MKQILIFLLFITCNIYCQDLPFEGYVTTDKKVITFDEPFKIILKARYLGEDSLFIFIDESELIPLNLKMWHGKLNGQEQDTLTLVFDVKFKESLKPGIDHAWWSVGIKTSFVRPDKNEEGHAAGRFYGTKITFSDYDKIKANRDHLKQERYKRFLFEADSVSKLIDSLKKSGKSTDSIVRPIWIDTPIKRDSMRINQNDRKFEFINKNNTPHQNNNGVNPNVNDKTAITISGIFKFKFNSVDYPLEYYTARVYGYATDPNNRTLLQTIPKLSNSSGQFSVSGLTGYVNYIIQLTLESSLSIGLDFDDTWTGAGSTDIYYHTIELTLTNLTSNYDFGTIVFSFSNGCDEFAEAAYVTSQIIPTAYNFMINNASYTTPQILMLYNDDNTVLPTSFSGIFESGTASWPGIVMKTDHLMNYAIPVALHEYGHVVMFTSVGFFPESGGQHHKGIRYNPQMAYSEGWATAFGCIVKNDPNLYYSYASVNLSWTIPYTLLTLTTPTTKYDGIEDEFRVAAFIWHLKSQYGLNYLWQALNANTPAVIGPHKVRNVCELLDRLSALTTISSSTWTRSTELSLFTDLKVVNNASNSIQSAINSVSQYGVVYVYGDGYSEALETNKSIGLFGDSYTNTMIYYPSPSPGFLITIYSGITEFTKIDGFTLTGNASAAILANSPVNITNNVIEECTAGVVISKNATIKNNFIKSNSDAGIEINSLTSAIDIHIYNNFIGYNNKGLFINHSTYNVNKNCFGNLIFNNSYGIYALSTSNTNSIDFSNNGVYNTTNYYNFNFDLNNLTTYPTPDPTYGGYHPSSDAFLDAGPSTVVPTIQWEDRDNNDVYSYYPYTYKNCISPFGGPEANWAVNAPPTTGIDDIIKDMKKFNLSQNYPNPFNPTTEIKYQVPSTGIVKIEVFNTLGQMVKTLINKNHTVGNYSVFWNGTNEMGTSVSSGIYIYRLQAGNFVQSRKMMLIK